jgi:hypothetical protein
MIMELQMLKYFKLLAGLVLCLSVFPAGAAAYKCTDGKKITYATQPCDELGLQSSGVVKNSVTVMPATPVEKPVEKAPEKGIQQMINDSADGSGEDTVRKASTIKPINPLVQKMLDW